MVKFSRHEEDKVDPYELKHLPHPPIIPRDVESGFGPCDNSFDSAEIPNQPFPPPPIFSRLSEVNMPIIRAVNSKVKVLSAATAIAIVLMISMAGFAIYLHFDLKAQITVNPFDHSPNCDTLEKKLELHSELVANLSALVSEFSNVPQAHVSSI